MLDIRRIITDFITDNFRHTTTPTSTSKPRIEYIDLAKGICIILVVVYHSAVSVHIPGLNAVRMPLYFLLSGLFFKDYGGGGISFIIKKINKILIPFIFFSAIPLLPYLFLTPKDCISILLYPVYGPDNINYPIWFLLCLFWTNMIYIIIHSFCKSILTKTLCVAAIAFSGYLLGKSNIYLPFYLSSALTSLPFFYLGVLSRKLPFLYQTTSKDRLLILSICIICIGAITYCWLIHTPYIAFRTNSYYGNIMEIYIIAIAMVLGLLTLCKVIVWIPVVSYLGRYSIIVLGLHGECLGFVRVLFIKFMNYEPSALLVLILTLFLCWLSIPVFKSIAPHFTAQKDLIHFNPTLKAAQ